MNDFRADLHCHTTCSDGSASPTEVVQLAAQLGLRGLSITDHDTIDAYVEAVPAAKQARIELLTGVEFSTIHRGVSVHVLAYAFALNEPIITELCQWHGQRRLKRYQKIMDMLAKQGLPVVEDEPLRAALAAGQSIGRPHIASAMMRQGYAESIEQAFRQYLGQGRSCYAAVDPLSVKETLDAIHQAKGLAVLAHPHLIQDESILRDMLRMPLDGIEAYYARFPMDRNQRWIDIASEKKWIITGGSDYHGTIKPQIALGSAWVSEEPFRGLMSHYNSSV